MTQIALNNKDGVTYSHSFEETQPLEIFEMYRGGPAFVNNDNNLPIPTGGSYMESAKLATAASAAALRSSTPLKLGLVSPRSSYWLEIPDTTQLRSGQYVAVTWEIRALGYGPHPQH